MVNKKKIVYIDMDGVVADFDKHRDLHNLTPCPNGESTKVHKGFFTELDFIEGAYEALHTLDKYYEIYFLSTPQWSNPDCWSEKRIWVEEKFGDLMFKKLILTHNKGLLRGDYLIDDRKVHGVDNFQGEHIHFGTERFPNWASVLKYLKRQLHKEEIKEMFTSVI